MDHSRFLGNHSISNPHDLRATRWTISQRDSLDQCCHLGTAHEIEYNEDVEKNERVIHEIEYNEDIKNNVRVIHKIEYNEDLKKNVLVYSISTCSELDANDLS